jgi:biopolymer transport protein ExbD
MAGGGSLGGGGKSKRGKSSKRKGKKRVGFFIDMTPLVDITFLLLTFFMFTTTMATPQIMKMAVPPEREVEVEVQESKLFTIMVDELERIFWYPKNDELIETNIKEIRKLAEEQNLRPEVKNELITSLKVSPKASYGLLVQILDELNLAEKTIETALNKEGTQRQRKFSLTKLSELDLKKLEEEAPVTDDNTGKEN